MKIGVYKGELEKLRENSLGLMMPVGFSWRAEPLSSINKLSSEWLKKSVEESDFTGKKGQFLILPAFHVTPYNKIILIGLGEKPFSLEGLRRSAGVFLKKVRESKVQNIVLSCPWSLWPNQKIQDIAKAIGEGLALADYEFNKYKTDKTDGASFIVENARIYDSVGKFREMQEGLDLADIMSGAAKFVRDLVNEPASNMKPKNLAEQALKISSEDKQVLTEVFSGRDLDALGLHALEGVAKGSDEPAYFIHMHYKPRGAKPRANVCLVGKGITFDSGGLSLKSPDNMESMKIDMAGAAAVLGVFRYLSKIKPRVEVHGLMPVCENMPSGKSLRPGDVIKTFSGKTVEVLNTDAEGRLILADALSYAASKLEVDYIIDLATLTGACVVALGENVAGLMSNNERLKDRTLNAAMEEGESVWPLPLVGDYKELLKSNVADIKNVTSKRWGGAITAALFLQEFVGKTAWAHLDIAGPAWDESGKISYTPKGGTGFGVRTILNLLKIW